MGKAKVTKAASATTKTKSVVKTTKKSIEKRPASAPKKKVDAHVHLTCQDGTSNKFYDMKMSGKVVQTTYGRVGTKGQETTKEFATAEKVCLYIITIATIAP